MRVINASKCAGQGFQSDKYTPCELMLETYMNYDKFMFGQDLNYNASLDQFLISGFESLIDRLVDEVTDCLLRKLKCVMPSSLQESYPPDRWGIILTIVTTAKFSDRLMMELVNIAHQRSVLVDILIVTVLFCEEKNA